MRTITNYLKLLIVIIALAGAKVGFAQTCTPTFSYSTGANGSVTFYGSAPGSTSVSPGTYSWFFPTAYPTGQSVVYTFTANGTYSVGLFYINAASTCSAITSQTITISNVGGSCTPTLNTIMGASGEVSYIVTPSSTVAANYFWNLGPGINYYGSYNADSAIYASNGTYYVAITYSTNIPSPCSGTVYDTVVVTNAGCNLNASLGVSSSPTTALVDFYNTTTGMNSLATATLDYGDGSPAYMGPWAYTWNFSHTYNGIGTYVVTLTVDNNIPGCVSTQTYSVTNSVSPCASNFSYVQGSNGFVSFSGTAVGSNTVTPGTYSWFFGNTTTTGMNTTNTFSANGTYVVTLMYLNASMTCSSSTTQTITITSVSVPGCSLNASFTYNTSGNGMYSFNNTSNGTTGTTTYIWKFGDNTTSTSASPSHTYSAPGNYNVWLVANNNTFPACVDSVMISVNYTVCTFAVGFTYTQNSNGLVTFVNTSTGASTMTAYTWDFGDGSPTSSASSPSHTYPSGTYTVSLGGSTPPNCSSSYYQIITVTNTCVANAGFSLSPTGTPQYWNAFVLYPTNVAAAQWSWGDSTYTDSLYCSHNYAGAGTYNICLSLTLTCGATANYCAPYAIYKSDQDHSVIHVSVVNPAIATGIKNARADNVSYAVSPNPNNGEFNLNMKGLNSKNVTVNVYNLLGKLVYSTEGETNSGSLDKTIQLNEVSNGVYFIKVNADNNTFTQKIIVSRQ